MPGHTTELHDHGGSLGALTVLSGELHEYRWDGEQLRRRRLDAGDQAAFPLGGVPAAVVIERNVLEWRCDPTSDARLPEAVDDDVEWVVTYSGALTIDRKFSVFSGVHPGGCRTSAHAFTTSRT